MQFLIKVAMFSNFSAQISKFLSNTVSSIFRILFSCVKAPKETGLSTGRSFSISCDGNSDNFAFIEGIVPL